MNAMRQISAFNALIVALTLAISVCLSTPSTAQSGPLGLFEALEAPNLWKDIPKNDWTLRAIMTLRSAGFVVGYPDGYFSGKRDLTRYEGAVAIQRMLRLGEAKLKTLTPELRGLLKSLQEEFKDEISYLEQPPASRSKRMDRLMSFGTAPISLGNYIEKSWPILRCDPPSGGQTLLSSFRLPAYARVRVKGCVGGFLE